MAAVGRQVGKAFRLVYARCEYPPCQTVAIYFTVDSSVQLVWVPSSLRRDGRVPPGAREPWARAGLRDDDRCKMQTSPRRRRIGREGWSHVRPGRRRRGTCGDLRFQGSDGTRGKPPATRRAEPLPVRRKTLASSAVPRHGRPPVACRPAGVAARPGTGIASSSFRRRARKFRDPPLVGRVPSRGTPPTPGRHAERRRGTAPVGRNRADPPDRTADGGRANGLAPLVPPPAGGTANGGRIRRDG